jgi:DNA replication protein DnaC
MGREYLPMNASATVTWEETEEAAICEKHGEYSATTSTMVVNGGRSTPLQTGCPVCMEERRAEQKRKDEEYSEKQRLGRIATNRRAATIPTRFAGCVFENYISGSAGQRFALSVAEGFAENFDAVRKAGSNLTFCGNPGCGKTHLACAIANHLLDAEKTVIYTTVLELIRGIRDTWRRDSRESETDAVAKYRNVDLLILDEVGVSFGSEAEKNQLFDVVDGRYREMRPTVIVSNLNGKALQECLGPRIFDRLMEVGSTVVMFDWGSYRSVAAPKPSPRAENPRYVPRETDEEMSTSLKREGCERREAARLKKEAVQ